LNKSESKYFNTAVRFDQALLALLEKKPFEYITISEICAQAGVNRSTFYLHYENICDLLHETSKYVLDGFSSCFPVDSRQIVSKFAECELRDLNFINERYLRPYLTYIRENRRVFAAVLAHPSAFEIESIFQRLFDNIFNPILERFHYPDAERKYVMLFYLNGITAIISEWVMEGCDRGIDDVSAIISHCIFGWDGRMKLE